MQSRLWCQIRSRPTPLLTHLWTKDAWFFASFEAYKLAGFVRRRKKKGPQCLLNQCKDSFSRKKYFGVRSTSTLQETFLQSEPQNKKFYKSTNPVLVFELVIVLIYLGCYQYHDAERLRCCALKSADKLITMTYLKVRPFYRNINVWYQTITC